MTTSSAGSTGFLSNSVVNLVDDPVGVAVP